MIRRRVRRLVGYAVFAAVVLLVELAVLAAARAVGA